MQHATVVGLSQDVGAFLGGAVEGIRHQQQGLVEEHLLRLALPCGVLLDTLAAVVSVPLEPGYR